jgi:hypothetical protein
MSHREFNLTVRRLPPVFNDGRVSSLRKLVEDFAGFQAGGFDWCSVNFAGCCVLDIRSAKSPGRTSMYRTSDKRLVDVADFECAAANPKS